MFNKFSTEAYSSNNLSLSPNFQNKNYLICSRSVNGLGDVSCGLKFATQLHEKLHIPTEHIIISTDAYLNDVSTFNQKYHFQVINFEDVKEINDIALQIFIPCMNAFNIGNLALFSTHKLFIYEYNFSPEDFTDTYNNPWGARKDATIKSLGLNTSSKELGIFIDHDMAKEALCFENDPSSKMAIEVSAETQRYILGNEPLENFNKTKKLYSAYAAYTSSYRYFIAAIAHLNKDDNKDLVIVTPCHSYVQKIATDENQFGNPNFLEELKKANITSCCVKTSQEDLESQTLFEENQGKKLTILIGRLPHELQKEVLLISEKETLTTGDQSLSEAISANKSFVYERLKHKRQLGLSLSIIGEKLNKPNKPVYIFKNARSYAKDKNFKSEKSTNFIQFFKNQQIDNYQTISLFNSKICKDYDCFPKIASLIKEILDKENLEECDLRSQGNFRDPATEIDYDKPYILNLNQICQLNISKASGLSGLKELADSTFECQMLGLGTYRIIRKKIL